MKIGSVGVTLAGTDYTWSQSLRFFSLGLAYAVGYALIPIAVVLWHNYENYSDPVDWGLVWKLTLAAVGPAAFSYWREHKALLKVPPWFDIPPEFKPNIKQVERSVQTITPATQDTPKTIETVTEKHIEPIDPREKN